MKKLIWLLPVLALLSMQCEKNADVPESAVNTENIYKITVEYLYDNCTYKLTHENPLPNGTKVETITGAEHNAEFTSISGYFEASDSYFEAVWGTTVLGKLTEGKMEVAFKDNGNRINLYVRQTREYNSVITGQVREDFKIDASAIGFEKESMEDGYPIREYMWQGSQACNAIVTYKETNPQYVSELNQIGCGSRARVIVKVFYKS